MTDVSAIPREWLEEILGYFLGRPSTSEETYSLPRDIEPIDHALTWWMFEGKSYVGLDGSLSGNWEVLAQEVARLRAHFNPRLRLVDHPMEPIDWTRTYARSGGATPREFVAQSTGIGISDAEWAALCGWSVWLCQVWAPFAATWNKRDAGHETFLSETEDLRRSGLAPMNEALRLQWLRTALRSRWPLLRNVVAETLKCLEQDETLDKVPLPKGKEQVFELLGMVRLIKVFQPAPPYLHWLTKPSGQALRFAEGTFDCHNSWSREAVVQAAYQDEGLPSAMKQFDLRVHCRPDLLCRFTPAKRGFAGMIVEFKSGKQGFSDALHQLRMYRETRKAQDSGRLILWGMVEQETGISEERRTWLREQVESQEDIWVFTGPDTVDIEVVMSELGLTQKSEG